MTAAETSKETELKCFKCGAPLFVLYRKIYDGTPVMGACKQHQRDLETKLKWQIQPLTPLGWNGEAERPSLVEKGKL